MAVVKHTGRAGCLALAHYLGQHQRQGAAAGQRIESTVIGSENDPWMPLHRARSWADRWGAQFMNPGEVGHINTDAGFGPWPLARYKVDQMIRSQMADRPRRAWGLSPVA